MDALVTNFFSFQFIFLALTISVIVYIVRVIAKFRYPFFENNKWWRDLILPLLPIALGVLIGLLAVGFAFPAVIASTISRVCFGGIAGMLSGNVFRVVKAVFAKVAPSDSAPSVQ